MFVMLFADWMFKGMLKECAKNLALSGKKVLIFEKTDRSIKTKRSKLVHRRNRLNPEAELLEVSPGVANNEN